MKNSFRIEFTIDDILYEYDEKSILSINIPHQISSNVAHPFYGVISQSANIQLVDKDKIIFGILNESANHSGYLDIYFNDINIAHLKMDNIEYNSEDGILDMQFKDDLYKLQNKRSKSYSFGTKISLYQIINTIYSDTTRVIGNYSMDIDEATTTLLEEMIINCGYVENDTYWNMWNKICECGLLVVYIESNKFCIRRII